MKKSQIFVADFETRAGEKAEQEAETWVWAWACCRITDYERVELGTCIDTFMEYSKDLGSCYVYFHNLKFDGAFIIDWLFKHGYTWVPSFKKDKCDLEKCVFTTMISEMGTVYTIKIRHHAKAITEIRDSYKKIPFSLDNIAKSFKTKYQKLEIDYVLDRQPNGVLTRQEEEYIKNDVRVIAEVIGKLYDDGLREMTIGSDCLKYYKKIVNKGNPNMFRRFFPVVDNQEEYFARKSYKGGWCYVKEEIQGKQLRQSGSTYDVNSLYPSMMHSNRYHLPQGKFLQECQNLYPYGEGLYYTGAPTPTKYTPLFIHHCRAHFRLKEGYLPTVQIKGNLSFRQNEYIKDSETMQELYMTNIDFDLFLEHYDILEIEHLDGYMYPGKAGFFDSYINKFMQDKVNGEGAVRNEAKLYLNNLYGKFAQRVELGNKIPFLDEERVRYHAEDGDSRTPVYTPCGSFITAYSRRFTISHAQYNYNTFCYADTDSIHCLGTPRGLVIDGKKLCCWSHECDWEDAKFLRQKTYVELVDGVFDIKCAGLPLKGKKALDEALRANGGDMEPFSIGWSAEKVKLVPKVVKGGVVLIERDFKIH